MFNAFHLPRGASGRVLRQQVLHAMPYHVHFGSQKLASTEGGSPVVVPSKPHYLRLPWFALQ